MSDDPINTNTFHLLFASIVTMIATGAFSFFFIKLDLSLEGKMGKVDNSLFRAENTVDLLCVAALLMFQAKITYSNLTGNVKNVGFFLGTNFILLFLFGPLSVASMNPLAIALLIGLLISSYIFSHALKKHSKNNLES